MYTVAFVALCVLIFAAMPVANKTKGHIAVLLANLFFGANFAAVKYITPSLLKPFALNVVRVIASLVLFALVLIFQKNKAPLQKKHIGRLFICAITGVAINQLMFIKGLSLTSSIHGALLMLVTPIFITFIAAWVLKEKLSLLKILGLISGVGGATFLILQRSGGHEGSDMLTGDVLIIINAIFYSFYLVMVRPLMAVYSPLQVVTYVFAIGSIMILPFGWSELMHTQWHLWDDSHFATLTFIVIGATFCAYLFNMYGVNTIGSSATGAYIYTQPVFAGIIAVLLMGEEFNWIKIVASIFIFLGVFLVNKK